MKKTFLYLIFSVAILAFSGCLKTANVYEGFGSIKPLADFPLSHLSSDTLTTFVMDAAASPTASVDTVVAVHLSDKNHVGNVTFQLGLGNNDPAFLQFMAANPQYTLMPSNLYTFDSTVTIDNAGVLNIGTFKTSFKTAALDGAGNKLFFTNQYVLPIIIKNGAGYDIASNFRMIIMSVQSKNAYDGNYVVTGTMVDAANSGLTGPYPWNTSLITNGPYQVLVQDNDYTGGIYHKILSGGSSSYYGSFGVEINFNADNTVANVVNYYGQPASNGRSGQLDPTGVNKYDPATKTLKVKYWMNQPGSTHRTSFDETYTFVSSR
jgi:hypothetical protein